MDEFIGRASIRQISKIWIITSELIYYWGMNSLERFFEIINAYIPDIYSFVDISEIADRTFRIRENRLKEESDEKEIQTHKFLPLGCKSEKIEDDIPEIIFIRDRFKLAFISYSSGIDKAEAWLYPYALRAGADADLEALTYFISMGELLISPGVIREKWRESICVDIERDFLLNKGDKKLIKKAKSKTLSIAEMNDLFGQSNSFPNFLSARDEEEDYITVTFFRSVEWLQLNEFEPWLNAYAQEISTAYQSGVDQIYSLFPLFYFCRSDLLLRKASKFGLEALLYGICVGSVDAAKPWKRYWEEPEGKKRDLLFVDYIPTASIIVFSWQRINPTNINREVLDQAILLLIQTQLASGAWPLTSRDTNGDILSTCLAITALSVTKPSGYQRYLDKAKIWLLNAQNEVGCWYIQGGPAVMINILCLEALKMADGINTISYKIIAHSPSVQSPNVGLSKTSDNYVIFCEGDSNGKGNKNFDERCLGKIFAPEFPNAVFCSIGSCKDIEAEEKLLFNVLRKVNPYHNIIKLIDRDDRSLDEIEDLREKGITVLSMRDLESYLLQDEIIERLCLVCGQEDKYAQVIEIKAEALRNSIDRGNPVDDIKSASGSFFTETKKAIKLTQCGNDTVAFLRDTVAPLITQDTVTYKTLRMEIFGC